MKISKLGLAAVVMATIAGVIFLRDDEALNDPFVNMYDIAWQQDWVKNRFPGDVSDYQSPIS